MAYTKYSLTPANNNAAPPNGAPEGMLPSAVNDTMRDMMAEIRDCGDGIRTGVYTLTAPVITGGSINGTTVGSSTAAAGNFTTLGASSTATLNTLASSGATLTGGSINNMAVGASTASTGRFSTLEATGVSTFSAGTAALPAITTTGDANTGIFFPAADTIAFSEGGVEAMRLNSSGVLVTTNDASISGLTVGKGGGAVSSNTALGSGALINNTTGSNNTASGVSALQSNTTASNNTAVGFSALFNNTTANSSTAVGFSSLINSTGTANTAIGVNSGNGLTTGTVNTFLGASAGFAMTTGSKNTIVGAYTGNQDGLDIRTLSNYAVISDGDGNRQITMKEGQTLALDSAVPNAGTGITFPATQSASSDANTLDDYEEGTWIPSASSSSGSITSFTSSGTYTKVGRSVFVTGHVVIVDAGTASGFLNVGGLPFTALTAGALGRPATGVVRENAFTGVFYGFYTNNNNITFAISSLTFGSVIFGSSYAYTFSFTYQQN